MSDTLRWRSPGSRCRRVRPVHAHRKPRWPRHVRTADIELRDYFQRRSSLTSVPRMCVTGSRGAVRPTRALMMSDTLSRRTSSSFRFESDAVRAHASTAPDHRFTYPHSPCGLLESCGSPRSESTCWTRSFFESEHSEPFYYRPEERPQAAAPSSSRCATQSMSASSCSTQHQQACACARAERPAVAAEDA